MNKWHFLACLLMVNSVDNAWGQGPGLNPSARPAFSPWLNLNRQGNSATLNYYGLVRPQVNFNNSIQQLQQQTTALQQQEPTTTTELPPTGHASGFLNHSKYFMNRGGTLGNRAAATASAAQQAPPRKAR